MEKTRYLETYFSKKPDNFEKMVFVVGPRQVGKTTLLTHIAQKLDPKKTKTTILNWDRSEDRKIIKTPNLDFFKTLLANQKKPVVIFDEIHKYKNWKTFLKGYSDTFLKKITTLITGSARLDVYRRGGDSLLGRYWLFSLHPLSLGELLGNLPSPFQKLSGSSSSHVSNLYHRLFRFGGFPEPYLKGSAAHHRRWVAMRCERLLKEDLRDLSRVEDLSNVEQIMFHVRESVGSTLSFNSIREKMNVSFNAVKVWMKWLEMLYYCFRISPYSKNITKGLTKEGKYFLYDWSELADEGSRFENLVAVHLKKTVDFWNDTGAGNFGLFYVRDQQKREVDFLITQENKPWILVESKLSEKQIPSPLVYMGETLKVPHRVLVTHTNDEGRFQVVKDFSYWVTGAPAFLANFV